ncbi:MAG: ABC transporter substrate-binding protein [Cellvibrionaceae bacterium]
MVKATSYVLMCVFICCSSIVACSKSDSVSNVQSSDRNSDPSSQKEQSKSISVAMSSLHEETFLPWQGGGGRKFYLDTIYEYLTYLNPETHELEPGLAESWSMSDSGKEWTLHIRKGIYFQKEWGEFTAHDAKYSIERLIDPTAKSGPSSSLRNVISEITVIDDYTLQITLQRPDIEFVYGYLSNAMQCMMVSKKYLEDNGDVIAGNNPIGTGAFGLESHKRGYSISISRSKNKNHWRVKNNTQGITFYSVPEEATRIAMLIAGEVDLSPVNFDSLKALERKNIDVLFLKNSWSPIVRFGGLVNTSEKLSNLSVPWQDQRVRQALNYAVDKDTILKAIFHNQGRVAGTDFPAEIFFDIKPYPYDPEKAKRLLVEAGYPEGFPITLKTFTTTPGAELPIIAEIIGMYWQQVGLTVDVVPIDWISHRSAQVNGKVNGIAWTHRGIAFPTPLVGLQASYTSNSVFSTFATEESEKMLVEIENSLILEEREKRIRQFGEFIHDQATGIFLLFSNEPYGVSDRVKHWPSLSQHVTNIDLIELKH